jgi:hypothetical protein
MISMLGKDARKVTFRKCFFGSAVQVNLDICNCTLCSRLCLTKWRICQAGILHAVQRPVYSEECNSAFVKNGSGASRRMNASKADKHPPLRL